MEIRDMYRFSEIGYVSLISNVPDFKKNMGKEGTIIIFQKDKTKSRHCVNYDKYQHFL